MEVCTRCRKHCHGREVDVAQLGTYPSVRAWGDGRLTGLSWRVASWGLCYHPHSAGREQPGLCQSVSGGCCQQPAQRGCHKRNVGQLLLVLPLCKEMTKRMDEIMIIKYLLLQLLLNLKLLAIIWTNQNLSSCKWVAIDWKGRRRLTPLQTQVAANSTSCMLSAMTTIKWSTIPYNVKWPL